MLFLPVIGNLSLSFVGASFTSWCRVGHTSTEIVAGGGRRLFPDNSPNQTKLIQSTRNHSLVSKGTILFCKSSFLLVFRIDESSNSYSHGDGWMSSKGCDIFSIHIFCTTPYLIQETTFTVRFGTNTYA